MDVMVDIETLANTSNAVITQIAAVAFDRHTGDINNDFKFKVNVDSQSCIDIGMEMNVDTIEWWMRQGEDARTSIFEQPRFSISNALDRLSSHIKYCWADIHNNGVTYEKGAASYKTLDDIFNKNNVNIWCHATFDEPVLSNAYQKCKLEEPWHYRGVRDLRTLVDLANYKVSKNDNIGVAHDALDDCLFQIKYTVECINKLS